ncbi:hypothetical protein BCEN4_210029 [Burkholderia cenocepacia]|nr:hypothetical protein BCEN4_210029 [Burkholderia cenocepacia]
MRRLQHAAVRIRRQVPLGLRLAQLLQAAQRRGDRREGRLLARDGARRGALQSLRRASGPRVRGRPARQDRFAVLHQFGCVKLRVPTRKRMSGAGRIAEAASPGRAAPDPRRRCLAGPYNGDRPRQRPVTQLRAP